MQEDQPAADIKTAPRVAGLEALTDAEIAMLPADFFTTGGPRVVVIDRTVASGPILLNRAGLAARLGVSVDVVLRWQTSLNLPCVRMPKGDRRYVLADVLDALRKASLLVTREPREGWLPPARVKKLARLAAEKAAAEKAAAEATSPAFVNPFASLTA